jgi:hypothetical protein
MKILHLLKWIRWSKTFHARITMWSISVCNQCGRSHTKPFFPNLSARCKKNVWEVFSRVLRPGRSHVKGNNSTTRIRWKFDHPHSHKARSHQFRSPQVLKLLPSIHHAKRWLNITHIHSYRSGFIHTPLLLIHTHLRKFSVISNPKKSLYFDFFFLGQFLPPRKMTP